MGQWQADLACVRHGRLQGRDSSVAPVVLRSHVPCSRAGVGGCGQAGNERAQQWKQSACAGGAVVLWRNRHSPQQAARQRWTATWQPAPLARCACCAAAALHTSYARQSWSAARVPPLDLQVTSSVHGTERAHAQHAVQRRLTVAATATGQAPINVRWHGWWLAWMQHWQESRVHERLTMEADKIQRFKERKLADHTRYGSPGAMAGWAARQAARQAAQQLAPQPAAALLRCTGQASRQHAHRLSGSCCGCCGHHRLACVGAGGKQPVLLQAGPHNGLCKGREGGQIEVRPLDGSTQPGKT